MRQRRWGEEETETGFIDDIVNAVGSAVTTVGDLVTGGPNKRAREATKQAQEATKQQELALERARIEAETARALAEVSSARSTPAGWLDKLKAPSPILGLPWFAVLAGGGAAAYWMSRR